MFLKLSWLIHTLVFTSSCHVHFWSVSLTWTFRAQLWRFSQMWPETAAALSERVMHQTSQSSWSLFMNCGTDFYFHVCANVPALTFQRQLLFVTLKTCSAVQVLRSQRGLRLFCLDSCCELLSTSTTLVPLVLCKSSFLQTFSQCEHKFNCFTSVCGHYGQSWCYKTSGFIRWPLAPPCGHSVEEFILPNLIQLC